MNLQEVLQPRNATAPAIGSAPGPQSLPSLEGARILIVDDESLNIDVVQAYLEMDGFCNVDSTTKAVKALAMVRDFRPDLLLLDINMPDLSGIEILKSLRA